MSDNSLFYSSIVSKNQYKLEQNPEPKSDHHRNSSSSSNKLSSVSRVERKDHKSSSSHSKSSSSSSSKRKHESLSKENEPSEPSQKKIKLDSQEKINIRKEVTRHNEKSSKQRKIKQVEVKEFDGSQGMGFAEALMMLDMPLSSSSKQKDKKLTEKIFKVPSVSKSPSTSPESSKPRAERGDIVKKSLQVLTNSDVSIPEDLKSAIKDYVNYSVLGAHHIKPQIKNSSDADLLIESFSSKASRTRVFSGNNIVQKTEPSLYEMCIRVLQENIDLLIETHNIPFHILRPVLERAKPEQLIKIEHYNSYLLKETDVIWAIHCQRKFRMKQRQEMESWRQMYERCTREDEEKLNRLTKNIKQHQDKAYGFVQKTKMTFEDPIVKPTRNVKLTEKIYKIRNKLGVSAVELQDNPQKSKTVKTLKAKPAPMMAKLLRKFNVRR